MKTTAENAVKVSIIPRTITKKALRSYFKLTPRRYKRLVPDELRDKMGLTAETDRYLEEYNIYQTKILIEELSLSVDELQEIGRLM